MIVQMSQFVHIGFNQLHRVDLAAVQQAIELESKDWMRYSENCYIVWTDVPLAQIAGRLLTIPGMNDNSFFVAGLNMEDTFGWLPAWAWEWMWRDRSTQPFCFLPPVPPISPY